MTHHPHVHMIVPGGGLSADGSQWTACRANFFLSVRVLSRLFRRRFLDGLAKLHREDRLAFFGDHAGLADRSAFNAFLDLLRRTEWVVYAKEPPDQVRGRLYCVPMAIPDIAGVALGM